MRGICGTGRSNPYRLLLSASPSWNASLNHVRGIADRTILGRALNIVAIAYSPAGLPYLHM